MAIAQFGPLVVETDIDKAVITTLGRWMGTYLTQIEIERVLSRGSLARPKNIRNTLEDEEFLDRSLPAIVVTTASTAGEPVEAEDGMIYAAWSVVVSAIVRGRTPAETRDNAALYGGTMRRILLHKPSLGGFAGEAKWVRGSVAPVADVTDSGRYLAAGINEFTVYVDEVVQVGMGPAVPAPVDPNDPYDPYATVANVTTTVNGRPIT